MNQLCPHNKEEQQKPQTVTKLAYYHPWNFLNLCNHPNWSECTNMITVKRHSYFLGRARTSQHRRQQARQLLLTLLWPLHELMGLLLQHQVLPQQSKASPKEQRGGL